MDRLRRHIYGRIPRVLLLPLRLRERYLHQKRQEDEPQGDPQQPEPHQRVIHKRTEARRTRLILAVVSTYTHQQFSAESLPQSPERHKRTTLKKRNPREVCISYLNIDGISNPALPITTEVSRETRINSRIFLYNVFCTILLTIVELDIRIRKERAIRTQQNLSTAPENRSTSRKLQTRK